MKPPSPKGGLFSLRSGIQNMTIFRNDPLNYCADMVNYPEALDAGIVSLSDSPFPVYLMTDPILAKGVLKNQDDFGRGQPFEKLRRAYGDVLLVLEKPEYLEKRKRFVTHFNLPTVTATTDFVTPIVKNYISSLRARISKNGGSLEVDFAKEMIRLLQKCILSVALGFEVDQKAAVQAGELYDDMTQRARVTLWRYIEEGKFILDPRSNLKELHSSRDNLDALIMNLMKEIRAGDKKTKFLDSQRASRKTGGPSDNGAEQDDVFVLDQIRMLFAAGHETTASTVVSVVDLLCDHEETLAALQSEIEKMTEQSSQFQDDFDLLNRVIVESIRLRPATWSFPRRVMNQGVKVGQFDIEKDATLFVSPYVLHRNPKYWKEATQFRPERFSQVTGFKQLQKDYSDTFLPFGAGDRICPGQWFALAEVRKIIYLLFREFRFRKVSKNPNYDARLLLVSDSFLVQVSTK